MTGNDLDAEIERAFPDQYEIERGPGSNDIGSQPAIRAQCRFCRDEFETLTSRRTHDCQGTRNLGQQDPPELFPMIRPRVHELGAHLTWAANGLSLYFAIVQNFDRVFGKELYFDACGDTWELNHDEEKIKYWDGKIAVRDEDTFDAFNEYQISVRARDSVRKRYVTFQFRPGLPNAQNVETGKPMQSLPTDTPESIRVQVHSANIDLTKSSKSCTS